MAKINSKLYGDQYTTLDDFMSDFQLMFDNACRYNEPDSQVYKVRNAFLGVKFCKQFNLLVDQYDFSSLNISNKI